ncbi:MAG TPA: NAD(P)H-binding protein [Polyangiaceae bacterium]|nr:NAD(P)H-binding protein [Polyangiaceae bacterium]
MIVILGATGKVGGTAARELRQRGREVRAVVRKPLRGAQLAELGCEIAVADVHDRSAVRRVLEGAESVLAICPLRATADDVLADAQDSIDSVGAAIDATRPEHVVAISDYAAEQPSGTGVTLALHRLEQRLRKTASPTTFIRSSEQMQNWMRQANVARSRGVLPSLHHPVSRPFPTVSGFDVGRKAAELLEGKPPAGAPRIVHLEGPRRYSAEDIARVFAALFGREVSAQAVPRERWADALGAAGLGPSYAQLVMELQDAHNAGRVDVEAGVGEVARGTTTLEEALREAVAATG